MKTDIEKETYPWDFDVENLFQIPNKEGDWTYYFKNGELQSEETYQDDDVIMKSDYYENGQLSQIKECYYTGEYDEMGEHYLYEISDDYFNECYSETGQLTSKVNNDNTIYMSYENEQLVSKHIFFKSGGSSDEKYKNGKIISKSTCFKNRDLSMEDYENGKIAYKITFFKNRDLSEEFYKNGQLETKITNFKNNDQKKEFYKNGELKRFQIYTNKNYTLKNYDKSGKLISSININSCRGEGLIPTKRQNLITNTRYF